MTAQEVYESHEEYFKIARKAIYSAAETSQKVDVPRMPEGYDPSLVTGRCRCRDCKTHRKP